MKIGIYGGTFDPPHLGHMNAAKEAIDGLGLDKLFFIPAANPPHKDLPKCGATTQQRFEMTCLMADGLGVEIDKKKCVEVLDIEVKRGGASYSVDTIAVLKANDPDSEFLLLMGSDMLFSFTMWKDPEKIASEVTLVAFARDKGEHEVMAQEVARLNQLYHTDIQLLQLVDIRPISSTQIREQLKVGLCKDYLWEQVFGYILRNQLYGTSAKLDNLSLNELQAVSWSMVKAKRLKHIKGCEEECVRLARRWGADEGEAARAGILHDCTKYLTLDEHLEICDKYAIQLDEMERNTDKLLHAKSGAVLAKYEFGQSEEVFQAILCHTTGKGNMSVLDKILYIADYMEPNRKGFVGLEELRKLAYEDLDAAMVFGCQMAVDDMNERGVVVHPNTLSCLKG